MLKRNEKEYKPDEKRGFSLLLFFLSIILIISTVFSGNNTHAQESTSQVENLAKDIEITKNKSSSPELDELEDKILYQKYIKDSIEERLSRLEELIFGRAFSNQTTENRLSKLLTAIPREKSIEKTEEIKPEKLIEKTEILPDEKENTKKVIYDEGFNQGILGAISQVETKVFNMTYNEVPFEKRVEKLEETILSKGELNQVRKTSLIERVSILLKRAGIQPSNQSISLPTRLVPNPSINQNNNFPRQNSYNAPQAYSVDPNTGFLINQATGEIAKDAYGNPIQIRVPQQPFPQQQLPQFIPPQQNYGYQFPRQQNQFPNTVPFGNPLQQGIFPGGQFPYDQLFNPNNLDIGGSGEEGY